jgi:alkylation response protein AidB-like acyl-CoA dehydrogenase
MNHRHLLDTVKSYLISVVAPLATDIDRNPHTLLKALMGLGELGVLALRVPEDWGGRDVSEETSSAFQELIARYSGALAFLQTQHQSAAAMLAQSSNISLKQKYLPHMGKGRVLVGVGFSHLRRQDVSLSAVPTIGGYQLDGVVPWITGWGMFHDFIVAATLPDGRAVFGVVPFEESTEIAFSTPAQLAAIASTNTVNATLTNFFLPDESIVFIKPAGWIHANSAKNILRPTFLTLGCALAGLDIIETVAMRKSLPFIQDAFESLNSEVKQCRDAIANGLHGDMEMAEKLRLRAWTIDLAVRCAHAAIAVSSGAANYSYHAAQRVYREALVFTVSGQTTAIMAATLDRLTNMRHNN